MKKLESLKGYEVLLCVTGGIACYKVADLASKLLQSLCGVNVAMSASAEQFVTPLTFQSLIGRKVYTSMWQSTQTYEVQHVSLTEQADLIVVAPATANIIGKMANGIADDLISTMLLAANGSCPVLIAPAMNTRMWIAPPVAENMKKLRKWGVEILGPEEGRMACGTIGPGRMSEPSDLLDRIKKLLAAKPPKNIKKL